MARQIGRAIAAVALVSAAAACLTACSGSTRSVEAFCSTMEEHKQAYLGQMEAAQGAGIDGLLTAISAVGDLKLMWKELAEVAPSDIQTDVEAVSEAWQKQEDNAGAGDWMASITTALLNSGSMSRVDTYVRENCDGDYTVDVATSGETNVAEEPEPEDYLATIAVSTAGGLIADWDEYAIGPHSVIYAAGDNKQAETTREFRMVAAAPGEVAVDTTATVSASSATGSISDAVYGAQVNTDADPGFAIAYIDEIPAAGAQPHNAVIMVKQFNGNGDAISEAAPVVDQFDGKSLVNVWLVGDIVAFAYTDADYNRILIGVNKDGSIAWQREADSEVYYARDGILTTAIGHWEGANGKIDGDLAGIDAATGQPVWTLSGAGFTFWNFEKPIGNGYVLASTGDYQNDFLNVVNVAGRLQQQEYARQVQTDPALLSRATGIGGAAAQSRVLASTQHTLQKAVADDVEAERSSVANMTDVTALKAEFNARDASGAHIASAARRAALAERAITIGDPADYHDIVDSIGATTGNDAETNVMRQTVARAVAADSQLFKAGDIDAIATGTLATRTGAPNTVALTVRENVEKGVLSAEKTVGASNGDLKFAHANASPKGQQMLRDAALEVKGNDTLRGKIKHNATAIENLSRGLAP